MERKLTIKATKFGIIVSVIELLGFLVTSFILLLLGSIFHDLANINKEKTNLDVIFKFSVPVLIVSVLLFTLAITLIVVGVKLKKICKHNPELAKQKSKTYWFYVVGHIVTFLATMFIVVWLAVSQINIYTIIVIIIGIICLALKFLTLYFAIKDITNLKKEI